MNWIKNFFIKLTSFSKPVVNEFFFKEIIIMKSDGIVIKKLQTVDHIPRTNNLICVDAIKYQVTSNVFNYDLKCIIVWVGEPLFHL